MYLTQKHFLNLFSGNFRKNQEKERRNVKELKVKTIKIKTSCTKVSTINK